MEKQQEMTEGSEAQVWSKEVKIVKDTSKPIRYKTIQKNTKLASFVAEEEKEGSEEKTLE